MVINNAGRLALGSAVGIFTYDISTPTTPSLQQTGVITPPSEDYHTTSYDFIGNNLVLSDGKSLSVIDFSDKDEAVNIAYTADLGIDSTVKTLHVFDSAIALLDGSDLLVVDLSDASNPTERGYYTELSGTIKSDAGYGDYVAVGHSLGFTMVDISDMDNPTAVGGGVKTNGTDFIAMKQSTVVLANSTDIEFDIFDVSTPSLPIKQSTHKRGTGHVLNGIDISLKIK